MPQPRSTADQVEDIVPRLDRLAHAVRLGARSQAHYDQLEAEAQRIAAALIAAFRGEPKPINPPLFASGGKAFW